MRRKLTGLLVLGAALSAVAAAAQRSPSIIPVQDIHPGMKGYGLTVFRGTKPERFDVQVIDVLKNFQPNQDLILIRTPNPLLNQAKAVAGMSGSPIYLDGKLAGAYAYGWSFAMQPVAGVTPIENMLREMKRPLRPDAFPGLGPLATIGSADRAEAARRNRGRLAGLPPYRGGRIHALEPLHRYVANLRARGGTPLLARAATPVMLGGFTDSVARMLSDALAPFGLVTLQAGGGGSRAHRSAATGGAGGEGPAVPYQDGGSIGVQLIRGDVSATAIGTVTHVVGHKLVAFGHPMLEGGELGLPTTAARVLHIFESQSRSFKIAEATTPLGTMIQDRQAAIVVDQTMKPTVIPVTIRLHGVPNAPHAVWHMEVPSHRVLSPVLTLAAISNAVESTASDMTDVVFTAKSRVDLAGYGPAEVIDKGYSPLGADQASVFGGLRLFDLMEVAYGNPFRPSSVEDVQVDLSLDFSRDVLEIVDASVPSKKVDPGATVPLRVVTRRYGEPDHVHVIPLHIPARAAGQKLKIELQPGDDVDIQQPDPTDVADMVHNVMQQYSATTLVVSMQMPSRGLRFRGHVVSALPPSALDTLQLVNDSEQGQPFVTEERQVVDMHSVLTGDEKLELQVRKMPRESR